MWATRYQDTTEIQVFFITLDQYVSGLMVQAPGGVVLGLPGEDPGPGVLLHRLLAALLQLLECGEELLVLRGGGVPRAVHVDVHHPRAEALQILAPLPGPELDLVVDNVESCHSCFECTRAPIEGLHHSWCMPLSKVVNKSFMQTRNFRKTN